MSGCIKIRNNYIPLVNKKGKDQQVFNADVVELQNRARHRILATVGADAGAVVGESLGAMIAQSGNGQRAPDNTQFA